MKRYVYLFGLSLLTLFVVLEGCQNPLDGVTIGLKDPIQTSVIECRLYDPAGNPLPRNTQVIISGPDAHLIVTTLNTKKFRINSDGVLMLAVSPTVTPSTARPVRFTIAVLAPDYLTLVQSFVVTNVNRQTRSLQFLNVLKPPTGVVAAHLGGSASNALSMVTIPAPDGDAARVSIPAGTAFNDRDGKPVRGKITAQIIHTNARTGNAAGLLPGGPVFYNVPGVPAGTSLRVRSIAGSVSLTLFNEQFEQVNTLSTPGQLTMELSPSTFNSTANRFIQKGDSIPLFSYDSFEGKWQRQKAGLVERDPATGRLSLQTPFWQAVTYIAAWTVPVCNVGPVFVIKSKLTDVDVKYRCQLVDAKTNAVVTTFYGSANNNGQLHINNQEAGQTFRLRVYDETDAWGKGKNGGLVGESSVATACDPTPVAVDLATLPPPASMTLAFQFSCPQGKALDESSLPALVRTQYSEVGKENWRDLVTATRNQRTVKSYKLQVGRRYDFRASTDGGASWPLRQNDYLVDKAGWSLKIRAEMYCK